MGGGVMSLITLPAVVAMATVTCAFPPLGAPSADDPDTIEIRDEEVYLYASKHNVHSMLSRREQLTIYIVNHFVFFPLYVLMYL